VAAAGINHLPAWTRDQADVELLTIAIESAIDDSDFFLRKAIGWALRDYARTDRAWVRSFAETHELSPLSRREALRREHSSLKERAGLR
jgi:3-methyladenine DNA glycosylase AlkD